MSVPYKMNDDGNVALEPIVEFATKPLMGTAVFLTIVTATSAAHLPDGDKRLQSVLTPEQALELAEKLQKEARFLLSQKPDSPAH